MRSSITAVRFLLAAVLLVGAGGTAFGDLDDISNVIFRIEATNGAGTGVLEFTRDELVYNPVSDSYHWNTGTQVIFSDTFDVIATLQNANLGIYQNDPKKIAGAFAVAAGDSDTTFTIQLPQLSFDALPASATAARMGMAGNVTDVGGGGVAMLPLGDADGIFLAGYNGLVPGGTLFGEALAGVTAATGSASLLDVVPDNGLTMLGTAVTDMSTRLEFTLTALDFGGGTHFFEIVPEPASLLVALMGVALLRRR